MTTPLQARPSEESVESVAEMTTLLRARLSKESVAVAA
jgi:hypothetical protein